MQNMDKDLDKKIIAFQNKYPELFWDVDINHSVWQENLVDRTFRRWDTNHIWSMFEFVTKNQAKDNFIKILNKPRSDFPPQYIPLYINYFGLQDEISRWDIIAKTKRNSIFCRDI